jgi:hypothetical protein
VGVVGEGVNDLVKDVGWQVRNGGPDVARILAWRLGEFHVALLG